MCFLHLPTRDYQKIRLTSSPESKCGEYNRQRLNNIKISDSNICRLSHWRYKMAADGFVCVFIPIVAWYVTWRFSKEYFPGLRRIYGVYCHTEEVNVLAISLAALLMLP